jgi:hypothetical protein
MRHFNGVTGWRPKKIVVLIILAWLFFAYAMPELAGMFHEVQAKLHGMQSQLQGLSSQSHFSWHYTGSGYDGIVSILKVGLVLIFLGRCFRLYVNHKK